MKKVIIIDGSYYVFYRYHAICMWWSKARHEDEPLEPKDAPRFIEKFKSTFYKKLQEFEKIYKITDPIRYVAKDCRQRNIWRMKLLPTYKQQRKDSSYIGFFLKLAYDELFTSSMIQDVLQHPHLEADDCAAITASHMTSLNSDKHVWIITSDHDYLQLQHDNISLLNLKGKFLTDHKECTKDRNVDLKVKIIRGDKSDNIPSIFPRCGYKTALKYASNLDLLKIELAKNEKTAEQYKLNTTLIDFNEIPQEHIKIFKENYPALF